MDERARRLRAGTEAEALGWGGLAAVARATRLARMMSLAFVARAVVVVATKSRIPISYQPWTGSLIL